MLFLELQSGSSQANLTLSIKGRRERSEKYNRQLEKESENYLMVFRMDITETNSG